jgi:hypothetical protein
MSEDRGASAARGPTFRRTDTARQQMPQEKFEADAPRGLKPARRIRNKGLIGTTEVVP